MPSDRSFEQVRADPAPLQSLPPSPSAMTEADQMRRERHELQRLLRRLLRGPVQLSQGQGGEEYWLPVRGRGYPADLVRRGVSREIDGTLSATGEAGAFLRRSLLQEDDAFGEQHRIATPDSVEIAGRRQTVRRNLAESPLSLLSRLKDRAGQPFLPEDALDAGERLLLDFTRARLQPRITASW